MPGSPRISERPGRDHGSGLSADYARDALAPPSGVVARVGACCSPLVVSPVAETRRLADDAFDAVPRSGDGTSRCSAVTLG